MFDFFRKKALETREFPDNEAAFAHACEIGYAPLIGAVIPALVLEEGGRGRDGEHTFLVRLAVESGVREFWCGTLKDAPSLPKSGDLVGFRVVMIASYLPEKASLVGYLACRLAPVLVAGKGWAVSSNFTPENLKPALHL